MSIAWKIVGLKRAEAPLAGTVTELSYSATHSDGPSLQGTVTLDPPAPDADFMPFEALSEAQALEWVWSQVSKDATEALLRAQAAQSEAAPPWGANPA